MDLAFDGNNADTFSSSDGKKDDTMEIDAMAGDDYLENEGEDELQFAGRDETGNEYVNEPAREHDILTGPEVIASQMIVETWNYETDAADGDKKITAAQELSITPPLGDTPSPDRYLTNEVMEMVEMAKENYSFE